MPGSCRMAKREVGWGVGGGAAGLGLGPRAGLFLAMTHVPWTSVGGSKKVAGSSSFTNLNQMGVIIVDFT